MGINTEIETDNVNNVTLTGNKEDIIVTNHMNIKNIDNIIIHRKAHGHQKTPTSSTDLPADPSRKRCTRRLATSTPAG